MFLLNITKFVEISGYYSDPCQNLTVLSRTLHLRCMTGFWIRLRICVADLISKKNKLFCYCSKVTAILGKQKSVKFHRLHSQNTDVNKKVKLKQRFAFISFLTYHSANYHEYHILLTVNSNIQDQKEQINAFA